MEVWVAETWEAHGESHDVNGVYDSREAAFEALKALPNMTVYAEEDGSLKGRPRRERKPGVSLGAHRWGMPMGGDWVPERWATAYPVTVQGRRELRAQSEPGT